MEPKDMEPFFEPKDMEPAEEEVHLGVYCLHMSSDSDRELECLGSGEPVGSNDDKSGSQPANNQGVAFRTRRVKDSVDGSSRKSSRYWCSCCEQNGPKEKKKKQTNKASKDPAEAQAIPMLDEKTDGQNVAFQDPQRDLTSSPSRKRATWNPRDEIELATAVLDGINSGIGGVKCGTDVMDVKSHKQFWKDVSGNIQSKIGHDRSKNQIIEKFKKMKTRFFTNAEQKQSAVPSSEGHEGQLFSILQQVFGTEEEQSVNLQENLRNPSRLTFIGNEDQVSLKRHRDNKGPSGLKGSVQDQVTEAANGLEEAGVEPLSPGEGRALSKAKHREELASAILDGIKSGLDAVEVGADLTSVESFNQFWENITEILQKKTGQVQSKYRIIQEFRKMQESHVANAMQQPSVVQTNDGQEEQLFRILQQNAGDERERDISDTALKERVKGSEDQASKPEIRNVLDQEGGQGGKMSCNGISYVLCLPSPNQTIIWNLQKHGTRKPEGRDLQDEMFTDAKDQEHDLSSPVQKKSGKAAKNSPSCPIEKKLVHTSESDLSSVVQKKLFKDSKSNQNSPEQKDSVKVSKNNPSSPISPGKKPVKRKSSYEVTIAEVISKVSQSSKRRKFAKQFSERISGVDLESSPSLIRKELANASENANGSSPVKLVKASKSNLSSPGKELAETLESAKQPSQKKLAKSPESNLSSPRQNKLAKTSENNLSSVSLDLPRRKSAKRNSQYEVTIAEMISKGSPASKRSEAARESSQKKSLKASESNPSRPQQELPKTSENAEQLSQKKMAEASETNLPFLELKASANSSENLKHTSLTKTSSNLLSPEQQELANTSEDAKQFSEKKSVKASETNASSPELNESAQALENAKQPPRKKLAKASKRNHSSPYQKELANTLEHNPSLLEEKELTRTPENNLSSPISSKRKSARRDSEYGVTISEMISKVRHSSKMCKSAKRSLQVELNIPTEALESNQQFLSKVKSADQTSPNEHGSVSQVSNDGGFTQVLLETKPNKWRSNEEIAIASAVLDAIKSGQFDVKLVCDNEWGKHLKLWEQVHKQIQSKTNKECTVNQVSEKFMKMRKKFLNMREIPSRKDRSHLGKHEQLFHIYQEIWHNEQSTAPPEEKSEMNKASPVSENVTSEMNVSQFLEVVLPSSICTGTQDEQHKQMEDLPGRENCDSSAGIKEVQDKCRELQTEEETEMNKTSPVSENVTLEMNVSNYLEVVPQPSLCTGTQNEQHKQMKDSPARANCDSSAGNIQVRDKYEELQTEEEIEMKKASPVSDNVTLEINVPKCLEVVPLPSICTEIRDERHKQQMEDSPVREICDSSAGIKHVQDKCEELRNETRAICVEMWQDCEEKFQDMQSRINEMLDNKMKELKETHAIQDSCFNERRLFFGEESSASNGSREIHLLMDKHLKYRSRKLQLMQELCRIEEEELETQHLMSQLKELRSHNLL